MSTHSEQQIVPILAGGGTRFSVHVGVLAALDDLNIHSDHIVGTSGGSIIAALYANNTPLDEIKAICQDVDLRAFKELSLTSLMKEGGLSSGDYFEGWIDHLLGGLTFAQLPKHLHIVATDLNTNKGLVFDRESTPDMRVAEAIRFTCTIPLLFSFKHYKNHALIDGSLLNDDELHRNWAEDNTPCLCFRIRNNRHPRSSIDESQVPKVKDYMSMLTETIMTALSQEYINDGFWPSTVIIDAEEYSPIDFDLNAEDKARLYQLGYETCMDVVPMKRESL